MNTRYLSRRLVFATLVSLGLVTASPLHAEITICLSDNFRDGNLNHNPLWTTRTPEYPWKVVEDLGHHSLVSGGRKSWDTLTTKEFSQPIEDGTFELEFKVRFNSSEVPKDGLNQFEIYLTDSVKKDGSGYRTSIAQNTTANSAIRKKTPEGYSTIAPMRAKFAFPTTNYVTVTWSRSADGAMVLSLNNTPYFTGTDTTFTRFDTLTLGTVLGGKNATDAPSPLVIYFTDIQLKTGR